VLLAGKYLVNPVFRLLAQYGGREVMTAAGRTKAAAEEEEEAEEEARAAHSSSYGPEYATP